jgi:hypothetical protein
VALRLLELVVKLGDIDGIVNEIPLASVGNMVDADDTTGGGVLEGG